jgi:hypothetical protein
MSYTSSIVSKYGDTERVKEDAKTLREIIERQGSSLVIDCLSEYIGETANRWAMDNEERKKLMQSVTFEFRVSLDERL